MKFTFAGLGATAVAASVVLSASPAFAWDCIRVSASPNGLTNSQKSGNWYVMTAADLVQGGVDNGEVPAEAVPCLLDAWAALGEPMTFAIGGGVAGAHGAEHSGHITDSDFFELAKNAPLKVMVNGQGVDHLDEAIAIIVQQCSS